MTRYQIRLSMLTNEGRVLVYDFDQLKHALFAGNLDMLNLKPLHNIAPHKKPVLDMHVPQGQESLCLTLGADDTVKVIDIGSGEILADLFLESDATCFTTVTCVLIRTGWASQCLLGSLTAGSSSTPGAKTLLSWGWRGTLLTLP